MQIDYLRISKFDLNDLNCLRFNYQINNCTTVAKIQLNGLCAFSYEILWDLGSKFGHLIKISHQIYTATSITWNWVS